MKMQQSVYGSCLRFMSMVDYRTHTTIRNRLILNGSGGRDRTYDLVINSHPLCR